MSKYDSQINDEEYRSILMEKVIFRFIKILENQSEEDLRNCILSILRGNLVDYFFMIGLFKADKNFAKSILKELVAGKKFKNNTELTNSIIEVVKTKLEEAKFYQMYNRLILKEHGKEALLDHLNNGNTLSALLYDLLNEHDISESKLRELLAKKDLILEVYIDMLYDEIYSKNDMTTNRKRSTSIVSMVNTRKGYEETLTVSNEAQKPKGKSSVITSPVNDEFKMLIVCEGIDGGSLGYNVAEKVTELFSEWFKKLSKDDFHDINILLGIVLSKISSINQQIKQEFCKTAATTFSCAIMGEKDTIIINIGDVSIWTVLNNQNKRYFNDSTIVKYRKEQAKKRILKFREYPVQCLGVNDQLTPAVSIMPNNEFSDLVIESQENTFDLNNAQSEMTSKKLLVNPEETLLAGYSRRSL